jgi:UDP-N-acetylglucosamine diphosphorylase/glucosamine-1-phosphate N-acetyltransferase
MQYILVDIADHSSFYPFTLTRSLGELRVGIFSFQERWELFLNQDTQIYTIPYLQVKYDDSFLHSNELYCFINVTCIPNEDIIQTIISLKEGQRLISNSGKWIATVTRDIAFEKILLTDQAAIQTESAEIIENALQLLKINSSLIQKDFNWVKKNRKCAEIDSSNRYVGADQIFVEDGAQISCANLNASEGPIYIGKEAVIMEGVSLRGPIVIGNKTVVKMNTSIYGACSIGPQCIVGGELKNSIMMGCSNKGHEGYLGDSIIGYWCNIGAGTCNSNIKNTAGKVQLWNQSKQQWETVGQKMGMLMGDYSRFAILSRINTGSYIGVSANVFGQGLLPKFLPNFTWGVVAGYQLEKVFDDINNWQKMKGFQISAAEQQILKHLHLADME